MVTINFRSKEMIVKNKKVEFISTEGQIVDLEINPSMLEDFMWDFAHTGWGPFGVFCVNYVAQATRRNTPLYKLLKSNNIFVVVLTNDGVTKHQLKGLKKYYKEVLISL